MLNFFTIGVYGSIEDDFFQKLINNNIEATLFDMWKIKEGNRTPPETDKGG